MTAVMTTSAAEASTVSCMERPASETRLGPTGETTGRCTRPRRPRLSSTFAAAAERGSKAPGRLLSILPAGAAAGIPCSGGPRLMAGGAKDILARLFAGRTLIARRMVGVRTTTDLSREGRRTIRF